MNKYLASSVDGSKLSATVSGLLISLSSIIILVADRYGISITPEQVTELASQAGLAVGVVTTLYGLLRKILVKVL